MDDIREHYLDWLRDAHAMEEQALTMMQSTAERLKNFPALRERIEAHAVETRRQATDLRKLLDERGSGPSLVKDTLGKMVASGQVLSGLFATDEVVKATMASYTFEHMEIAAYKALISAARVLDDEVAIAVFERHLKEERAMADWLLGQMDQVARAFLARDEVGLAVR